MWIDLSHCSSNYMYHQNVLNFEFSFDRCERFKFLDPLNFPLRWLCAYVVQLNFWWEREKLKVYSLWAYSEQSEVSTHALIEFNL